MPADTACVSLPGPWTHRHIQANGAQFHAAHAGQHFTERPLVVFVHGFPQYWWAWRNQIDPVAQAGYEVIAIDQRGIGGSDKTPQCEDALTLSQDLIGIVRSMGARKAVLVGLGRGGALAWSAASMEPGLFAGLVSVSSPHPRTLHRIGTHLTLRTWRYVAASLAHGLTRRGLTDPASLEKTLASWSASGNTGASGQAELYTQAMQLPGAAAAAIDQLRWTWRAQHSPTGRAYLRESANSIRFPVLAVRGEQDPLLPGRAWAKDREFAVGPYRKLQIAGAGHFVPEEQPEAFTNILIEFLDGLPMTGP